MRSMSPEDELQSPLLGFSSTREDVSLSCGDLDSSPELGRRSRTRSSLLTRTPDVDISCHGDYVERTSPLLKIFADAEAAANSAAIQLVSFKDAMEDEFADSRQSATDKRQITRQRGLLLEKLEDFRRINKSVRQKLKQLRDTEADRIDEDKQIDSLLKRIAQAENENEENIKSAVHMTKSVEATRAHLQGQLRNKEAENNRLTVQLRTFERTITEQKMEIDDLKGTITSLSEQAAQDKESLKKATRAQKLRAERFEAAVEKCYTQMKEKDVQLANARLERDSRRRQKEQMTDEKEKFVTQIEILKRKMDQLHQENLELVRKLAAQEEAFGYSNRQLDQRSSECQALSRQLEVALSDVRQQVNKVKDQAVSREQTLQTKILELEAEKSRRDNELRLLRQSKQTAEKQFEVRLKDLQLSLDQSESHKQSIQNYVDFLKNSYKTMFDEGLQTSSLGSSYFLK
eukprot:superscaffoldBa00002084_g13111